MGWLYLVIPLLEGLLCLKGTFAFPRGQIVLSDYLYLFLLLVHVVIGLSLIVPIRKRPKTLFRILFRVPELLFMVTLLFFLFSYIYALNANMDYVQRFIASGGAVRLALDTSRERLASAVRFLPLILLNSFAYIYLRITRRMLVKRADKASSVWSIWALPLVLVSVVLGVFCFPSFISLKGFSFLSFVALVPLLMVLESSSFSRSVFYVVSFGVLQGMLINFWLGTYSLISLQLVSLFFLIIYTLFFIPALYLYKRFYCIRFVVLPVAWVLFEYLRSIGFLGYPWGLWGTTQYQILPLIQVASITGVWGVSFMVLLVNSCIACTLSRCASSKALKQILFPLLFASGVFMLCFSGGAVSLYTRSRLPLTKNVRVALIQQNSDPRKHDYQEDLQKLIKLTDRAVLEKPDIVIWSETAFVPNIRRWSRLDPDQYYYAGLVRSFLEYQKDLNTWLLTGNDDYEISLDENGVQNRLNYNAAILFSPTGRRAQTYHKIRLVPFTEYFPWKKELPGVYGLLLNFDVHLWEPGQKWVIFRHPKFSFATPICFEDAFPNHIRSFILKGTEAIVNISNDYWSLSEIEAKQHTINSIFRAVENRKPLLRSTASGLTCYVDSNGRLIAAAPYYQETYLVVDVVFRQEGMTFYTRYGDWFPWFMGFIFGLLFITSLIPGIRKKL